MAKRRTYTSVQRRLRYGKIIADHEQQRLITEAERSRDIGLEAFVRKQTTPKHSF